MKNATMYLRDNKYYIHPSSSTIDGIWIATKPFIVISADSHTSVLRQAITDAILASASDIARPSPSYKPLTPLYDMSGVKTWNQFIKLSYCVDIEYDSNEYTIIPTHKEMSPDSGFQAKNDLAIILPDTISDDVFAQAIRNAFSQCT